jgi:hypothetical protein
MQQADGMVYASADFSSHRELAIVYETFQSACSTGLSVHNSGLTIWDEHFRLGSQSDPKR